ncbi:MAG: Tfp pilus assembly protein FimT/FimU [Massilia sp.]
MFPVIPRVLARSAGGYTLIEAMVGLAVLSILLGLGIPAMSAWMLSNKAASANEFYMEGFRLARQQAIAHNSPSRIVLTANQTTGQMDWQVDICFPSQAAPCTGVSSNWSTPTAAAANDRDTVAPFKSVQRSADVLPSTSVIAPTLFPANSSAVYYTALGWVDTSYANNIARLQLDPLPAFASQLPTSAISITLAGMPTRCSVGVASSDSRACPQ